MQRSNSSVADMAGSTRAQQVAKNVHYIKSIAEVILLCCQQNIALRGHRESEQSLNKGNFLENFHLLANHDKTIEDRLKYISKNAVYTSPYIQNDILEIMGGMIREKIAHDINMAKYFTIMADESKHCSKKEQLAIVFRYVDVDFGNIHERFLTFVEAENFNAESLTGYIKSIIDKYKFNISKIVSQCYDGVAVMSGNCSGVQHQNTNVCSSSILYSLLCPLPKLGIGRLF